MEQQRQLLPEGLDAMTPGSSLGALLDTVDLDRVNGYDAVILAQATARQIAHDQARLLACLATIARCHPGGPDAPPADPTPTWNPRSTRSPSR